MVELDAESVLTIPRHIHAKEVVERGFMSNFLFTNISSIFGAPKEIIDLINGMQAIEQPSKLAPTGINGDTADELNLNEDGEVEISQEQAIGLAQNLFGDKVYGDVDEQLAQAVAEITEEHAKHPDPEKDQLATLREKFSKPIADILMETARQQYGRTLKRSTQNQLKRRILETTDSVVSREYGDYTICDNQLEKEQNAKIAEAQKAGASKTEISQVRISV